VEEVQDGKNNGTFKPPISVIEIGGFFVNIYGAAVRVFDLSGYGCNANGRKMV
jgi:hypothetical protein